MIELCFQCSIQPKPPWLVPLPKRQALENTRKFVIHLFLSKMICSCETSECLEVVSNIRLFRKNIQVNYQGQEQIKNGSDCQGQRYYGQR